MNRGGFVSVGRVATDRAVVEDKGTYIEDAAAVEYRRVAADGDVIKVTRSVFVDTAAKIGIGRSSVTTRIRRERSHVIFEHDGVPFSPNDLAALLPGFNSASARCLPCSTSSIPAISA